MNIDQVRQFLLWSTIINYTVLVIWLLVFLSARGWLYNLHTRWFRFTPEQFSDLNYGGLAIYKIAILIFNLAPLIALMVVR